MRLIVPLRGGSRPWRSLLRLSFSLLSLLLTPALLETRRSPPDPPPSDSDLTEFPRTSSRSNLFFSRGNLIGRVRISSRAVPVRILPVRLITFVTVDPYDRMSNRDGITQLVLDESTLYFNLLQRWMSENFMESMMMHSDDGEFDVSSIAMYKPFEGLLELRVEQRKDNDLRNFWFPDANCEDFYKSFLLNELQPRLV